ARLTSGNVLQHAAECRRETLTRDPPLRRHPGPDIPWPLNLQAEGRHARNREPRNSQVRSAPTEVSRRQCWFVFRQVESLGQPLRARLLYSRLHVARVPNSNIPIDDHRPQGTPAFLPERYRPGFQCELLNPKMSRAIVTEVSSLPASLPSKFLFSR